MAKASDIQRFATRVVTALRADYPDAQCALNYKSPLQLLIATILSAQCTDVRVNIVTKELFKKYRTAADYATADRAELERDIQSTGFFRNKAKSIQECCRLLVERFDGQVPPRIEDLVDLPGVGRKTANVVLGTAFGIASGVVVDTHVGRITQRLGMTKETTAEKIERDLQQQLPEAEWILFSHRLIHHGRKICAARKPLCEQCSMADFCPKVGVGAKAGKKR